MRTKSAQVDAILANPNHTATHRVVIYDSAGSSTYELTERVTSVEVKEDVDGPRTASVRLFRSEGLLSLSPLTSPDALDPFSGAAVVAVGRRIKAFVSVQPADFSVAGTEIEVFDGFVDEVSWPEDEMDLTCTDRRAKARDTWIERERVYGLCQGANATKGAYIWKGDLFALVLNDLVVPSAGQRNGHYYKATTVSGAQGTTEPAWPTGSGATVVSGGVTFTEAGTTHATTGVAVETLIQQLFNDNGLSSYATLQTPVSPSWNIKPFEQERMSVWDAVDRLASQMGWTLRYEWNSSLSRFELTLREPPRSSVTVARSFALTDELELRDATLDVYDIRNVVRVNFSNTSVGGPQNDPVRTYYDSTDSASVTKYGRRFMEIQEADSSNIDTPTEAARMADAIRDDLSEPTCRISMSFPIDPFLELGDRVTIPSDGFRWDASQTLAIASLSLLVTAAGATSTLELRGKPAARMRGWHQRDGRADRSDVHRTNILGTAGLLTVSPSDLPGGTKITVTNTAMPKDGLQKFVEFHLSGSASFTPSSSTLVQAGAADAVTLSNLIPGKTYYTKVIPYTKNGDRFIRGEASTEVSFVAGRANAAHLVVGVEWGRLPLNGGFETWNDTGTVPDHWEMDTGGDTWGTGFSKGSGSGAISGDQYLVSEANYFTSSAMWTRDFITVVGGRLYFAEWLVKVSSAGAGPADLDLKVEWFDYAQATISTSTVSTISGNENGSFTRYGAHVEAPSGARFAKVIIAQGSAGTSVLHVDSVRLVDAGEPWQALSYESGWADETTTYADHNAGAVRRDEMGRVHLRGMAEDSGFNTLVATLPAGYQPAARVTLPAVDPVNAKIRFISIVPDGSVYTDAGGGPLTLDGIVFDPKMTPAP